MLKTKLLSFLLDYRGLRAHVCTHLSHARARAHTFLFLSMGSPVSFTLLTKGAAAPHTPVREWQPRRARTGPVLCF